MFPKAGFCHLSYVRELIFHFSVRAVNLQLRTALNASPVTLLSADGAPVIKAAVAGFPSEPLRRSLLLSNFSAVSRRHITGGSTGLRENMKDLKVWGGLRRELREEVMGGVDQSEGSVIRGDESVKTCGFVR